VLGILMPLLAGAVVMTSPAQAQFSPGFKFLEAVRKKDGNKGRDRRSSTRAT
jgi:uncharacterized protein